MTYTIVARCPRTGHLGIGIATYSLAVGGLCPAVESNVGAVSSQAFVNPELKGLGLRLLKDGYPAARTLAVLERSDPWIEYRQIGIVDREGRVAAFTGGLTRGWSGHRLGDGYVAFGNVLANAQVVDAMAHAFEHGKSLLLADRLLLAVEAGRDAGGQAGIAGHLPERSASILVHGLGADTEIDLRVDMHTDAVSQLRRIYDEYRPYVAFHRTRWIAPQDAIPQDLFVEKLTTR